MSDEFDRLKDLFDLFKLGTHLTKQDFMAKARAYVALKAKIHKK
jgi:hypothetical protein